MPQLEGMSQWKGCLTWNCSGWGRYLDEGRRPARGFSGQEHNGTVREGASIREDAPLGGCALVGDSVQIGKAGDRVRDVPLGRTDPVWGCSG